MSLEAVTLIVIKSNKRGLLVQMNITNSIDKMIAFLNESTKLKKLSGITDINREAEGWLINEFNELKIKGGITSAIHDLQKPRGKTLHHFMFPQF